MPPDDDLLAAVREQTRWLRASVLPQVRETVDQTLTTTQLRRAYEMCDGTVTGAAIAKAAGVSGQSASNWTRRWRDLGIAFENESGHVEHLVSLKSLGLSVEVKES